MQSLQRTRPPDCWRGRNTSSGLIRATILASSAKNSSAGRLVWEEYAERELEQKRRLLRELPTASDLRIKTVRYSLTVNADSSSFVRLDAEAAVPTDGTAESTLRELESWVHSVSPSPNELLDQIKAECTMVEDDLADLRARRDRLEAEYQRFRKVFEHLGLNPDEFLQGDERD